MCRGWRLGNYVPARSFTLCSTVWLNSWTLALPVSGAVGTTSRPHCLLSVHLSSVCTSVQCLLVLLVHWRWWPGHSPPPAAPPSRGAAPTAGTAGSAGSRQREGGEVAGQGRSWGQWSTSELAVVRQQNQFWADLQPRHSSSLLDSEGQHVIS